MPRSCCIKVPNSVMSLNLTEGCFQVSYDLMDLKLDVFSDLRFLPMMGSNEIWSLKTLVEGEEQLFQEVGTPAVQFATAT